VVADGTYGIKLLGFVCSDSNFMCVGSRLFFDTKEKPEDTWYSDDLCFCYEYSIGLGGDAYAVSG
jgi:hypothetical protein